MVDHGEAANWIQSCSSIPITLLCDESIFTVARNLHGHEELWDEDPDTG